MHLKFYLVTILLVVLFPVHNKAEDEEEADEAPKSCITFTIELVSTALKTALKCISQFRPRRITEYVTRAYCIIKCVLQEFGSVDAEGNFDSIGSAFYFEESFPQEVKDVLLPKAQECFPLAEQFNNKDYWCKSYSPFIICVVKSLVSAVLPHILGCFVTPIVGTLLEVLKALAPDSELGNEIEEMRRLYNKQRGVYCLNHNCSTKYRISKTKGGASTMILYHKNMTEIGRGFRTPYGFNLTSTVNVIESPMNDTAIIESSSYPPDLIIEDSPFNVTFTINSNDTGLYDNYNDTSNSYDFTISNINSVQIPKIIDSDEPPNINSDEPPNIIIEVTPSTIFDDSLKIDSNYSLTVNSESTPNVNNENSTHNGQ